MRVRWDLVNSRGEGPGRRIQFEGLRQREASLPEDIAPDEREYMLAHTQLTCQTGGRRHDALACVHCRKFVGYRPSLLRHKLVVRCLWHDRDLVRDLMTTGSALLCVESGTSVQVADRLCRERDVTHVLVVDGDELVGIADRSSWFPFDSRARTVAEVMDLHLPLVPDTMDLGEAAGLMADLGLRCLVVTQDDELAGILTRSDLQDVGVSPDLLGSGKCVSCSSRRGVRSHPQLDVDFCLDCLEQAFGPVDEDGVWEGC